MCLPDPRGFSFADMNQRAVIIFLLICIFAFLMDLLGASGDLLAEVSISQYREYFTK